MGWPRNMDGPMESDPIVMAVFAGILVTLLSASVVTYRRLDSIRSVDKPRISAGGKCPWHPWQFTMLAVLGLDFAVFYGPVLWSLQAYTQRANWQWVVFGLFHCIFAGLFIFLETYDPSAQESEHHLPIPFQCSACGKCYGGEHRKHCFSCNKCVIGFDHHCRYLNQCIGKTNYIPWIIFMTMAALLLSLQLVMTLQCHLRLWGIVEDENTLLRLVSIYLGEHLYLCCTVVGAMIQVTSLYFVLDLLVQHVRINIEACTSHQFVSSYTWWGSRYRAQARIGFIRRVLETWVSERPRRLIELLRLAAADAAASASILDVCPGGGGDIASQGMLPHYGGDDDDDEKEEDEQRHVNSEVGGEDGSFGEPTRSLAAIENDLKVDTNSPDAAVAAQGRDGEQGGGGGGGGGEGKQQRPQYDGGTVKDELTTPLLLSTCGAEDGNKESDPLRPPLRAQQQPLQGRRARTVSRERLYFTPSPRSRRDDKSSEGTETLSTMRANAIRTAIPSRRTTSPFGLPRPASSQRAPSPFDLPRARSASWSLREKIKRRRNQTKLNLPAHSSRPSSRRHRRHPSPMTVEGIITAGEAVGPTPQQLSSSEEGNNCSTPVSYFTTPLSQYKVAEADVRRALGMIDVENTRRVTLIQIERTARAAGARISRGRLQELEGKSSGTEALPIAELTRKLMSVGESKADVENGFALLAGGGAISSQPRLLLQCAGKWIFRATPWRVTPAVGVAAAPVSLAAAFKRQISRTLFGCCLGARSALPSRCI